MFTVEYRYYNYSKLEKTFDSYVAAKGFFWKISKSKGVKNHQVQSPRGSNPPSPKSNMFYCGKRYPYSILQLQYYYSDRMDYGLLWKMVSV